MLFVAGLIGTLLTGIYAFRLFFRVFLGEPSQLVAEHSHAHGHGEGPWTMMWPVGILAVLSVVGGWLQVAGVWHPFGEWLDPVALGREHLALVEPTVTQDYVTSAIAVGARPVGDVRRVDALRGPQPAGAAERRPSRTRSSTSSGSTSSTT